MHRELAHSGLDLHFHITWAGRKVTNETVRLLGACKREDGVSEKRVGCEVERRVSLIVVANLGGPS